MRLLILSAVVSLAVSCGRLRADAEFYEGVPTLEGLTLEVTGDASEGAAQGRAPGGVDLVVSPLDVDAAPELLRHTRAGVRLVNQTVKRAFEIVHALMEEEGQLVREGVRVYGPQDRDQVTYRLTVRRFTATSFGFKLQAKPVGAEDSAYQAVMGGAMTRGDEAHRGRGVVGINLDRYKLVDPAFPGQGVLLAGFAHRSEGKALAFRAQAFTPNAVEHPALSAAFVGWRRHSDGGTGVRLATQANLENLENGTEAKELIALRARWIPEVGGRAAAVATGGDIPEGTAYLAHACWNAATEETFKVLSRCVRNEDGTRGECAVVHQSGSRETCRVELGDLEPTSRGLLDTTPEEGGPALEVTVPEEEPTGDSER